MRRVAFGNNLKLVPDQRFLEEELIESGFASICGVDEAGRGPLAGPVVAAAVMYRACDALKCACDSKSISEAIRDQRYAEIIAELEYGLGMASPEEIDSLNILQASLLAMQRAVEGLGKRPIAMVLVDGTHGIPGNIPSRAIVSGDARVAVIGAASIIAKVTRDSLMRQFDQEYPAYGFAEHKGYPTSEHRRILNMIGPCPIHRKTFRGVRELLDHDC